jgi:hypothetical protein
MYVYTIDTPGTSDNIHVYTGLLIDQIVCVYEIWVLLVECIS